MQKSILSAASSRAFFLATCLVAPQVINSELVPGLNNLVDILDASEFGSDIGFRRNLQVDPEIAELFDDDAMISSIANGDFDEDFIQCTKDTQIAMDNSPMDVDSVIDEFSDQAVTSVSFGPNGGSMTIEYPEDAQGILRQACKDFGGSFVEMKEPLSCDLVVEGITSTMVMSGFVTCVARTAACKSTNPFIAMKIIFENEGGTCGVPEAVSDEVVVIPVVEEEPEEEETVETEPVVEAEPEEAPEEETEVEEIEPIVETEPEEEPESVGETEEDSSLATDSAGNRHQWKFGYCFALAGVVVGASSLV